MKINEVTISRYWKNPKISIQLTEDFIALSISFDDFLVAVKEEIGSVTYTFRDKTFAKQFDEAVTRVLNKIKEESKKVV